ncbi:hypothetical protein ACNOYE_23750 [Nannocystaceae bacterium ST9]
MTRMRYADADSVVVLDDTYSPVIIVSWIGEPTLELVEIYQRWQGEQIERAKSAGLRLISLTDCSRTERPSSRVRKAFSEDPAEGEAVFLKSIVVITSPVIRGALTAVKWLMGDRFGDVEVAESTRGAITRCLDLLDQHGIARPSLSPTSYRGPVAHADERAEGG